MIRSETGRSSEARTGSNSRRAKLLSFAVICFGVCVALLFVLLDTVPISSDPEALVLLILALLLAMLCLGTSIPIMLRQAQGFDLLHPLFYAAWFFFLPQFTVASILLILNLYDSLYERLLPDLWGSRITAMGAAAIAYVGLLIGYMLPAGRAFARRLPQYTTLSASINHLKLPVLVFFILGGVGLLGAFSAGLFGYQLSEDISSLGGLYSSFSSFFLIAQGICWFAFFKNPKSWAILTTVNVGLIITSAIISGSRGALLNSVIVAGASYLYAQSRPGIKHMSKWAVFLLLALVVGMAFGTTFRDIKSSALGRATLMNMDEVTTVSQLAVSGLQEQSISGAIRLAVDAFAVRIDGISSLAVILTYADRYREAEIGLGIDHNIYRDFVNSVVPRFVWPSKPIVGAHHQIGNLYFDSVDNSPATTYMGDLYRNFTFWGIFPGMVLLGIALRAIYIWLIEGQPRTALRAGLYMPIALLVNYEALYSTYFPGLIRIAIIVAIAIVLTKLMLPRFAPKSPVAESKASLHQVHQAHIRHADSIPGDG